MLYTLAGVIHERRAALVGNMHMQHSHSLSLAHSGSRDNDTLDIAQQSLSARAADAVKGRGRKVQLLTLFSAHPPRTIDALGGS